MSFTIFGNSQTRSALVQQGHRKQCYSLSHPSLPRTHLRFQLSKQKSSTGRRRCPLQVQAGLNYPHMPNRMRRQIQEAKYTVQLYLARFAHLLASLPGFKQVVQAWKSFRAKLDPYLVRLSEFREKGKEAYLKRVDMYDEFCLAELKRKYRWKAYARRDEEVLTSFLKIAFYRIAVVLCIAEWQFLAPCGLVWTGILPFLVGRAMIPKGDPMWWWYLATMVLFITFKHPVGMPLRWI